jgi:hypothetical protein
VAEQPADDWASLGPPSRAVVPALTVRPDRRRPRRRVVLPGLVAAVLLVVVGGAFAVLNAGSGPSPIDAYAPREATAFAEVRFDAPGDQKIALAQLLLRVPGLSRPADASGEMASGIASLVGAATGHPVEGYPSDVRSWVGGAIGVAAFLPADGGDTRLLAMIGVHDVAGAGVWADAYLGAAGGLASTEQVRGGTLRHGADGSAIAVVAGDAFGGGTGSVLLAGAEGDVRSALNAAASGNGLASTDGFRAARSALPGDELGRVFADAGAARSWLAAGGFSGLGWTAGQRDTASAVLARLPAWAAIRIRAEGDALTVGAASTGGSSTGTATADSIAGNLPSDTVAVLELRDAGALLSSWLDTLRTTGARVAIDTVDGAISGVGGIKGVLAQVGVADALATWDGSHLRAGLVIRTTDAVATRRLLDSVRALAAFAKAPLTDEAHGETTITTAQAPDAVPDLPLIGRPTVEVAMRGDLLILGVGSGFASAVLDAGPGHSLAGVPAYQRAIARAGANGTASCFVDAQAARGLGDRLGVGNVASPTSAPSASQSSTPSVAAQPSASASPADAATLLEAIEALGCNAGHSGSAATITLALTVR